jgi:hypothetical protein
MVDALTVYVDDSGSDTKSKVAAAAFCVSTVERWQKLLQKWRKIAFDAGFDLKDFHMAEFVACRRGEPCQQCQHGKAVNHPWKNWSDNKRKSVLTRMAKAIVKNVEFGVGHAYTKADYDEHVLQSPARSVANEPLSEEYYTFAVQRCGGSLAEWRAANSRMVPLKFVFDSASNRTKKEIARVFFGAANREQHINGIEQWFNPEEGVSYESRKQVHQLLTADMLAWMAATMRARLMFGFRGRNHELYWIAKLFVPSKNIRLGYMEKEAMAQWEKDKLNEAAKGKSGVSEFRQGDEGTTDDSPCRDQSETRGGEGEKKAKKRKKAKRSSASGREEV